MNGLLQALGIESFKPLFTSLLLPPVPLLALVLYGARRRLKRPLLGAGLTLAGVLGLYLCSTQVLAHWLMQGLIKPPPALRSSEVAALKHSPHTAIVVLGAGRRLQTSEYGVSTLKPAGIERLRYGAWLARETGLPLAFSGGIGHGSADGATEAEIAGLIAEREFGRPLRWQEGQSRDTHENAVKTVALLAPQGITTLVIVTDAVHMPRALLHFEAATLGTAVKLLAAPMGSRANSGLRGVDWLPSPEGQQMVWLAWHEWLGRLAGA